MNTTYTSSNGSVTNIADMQDDHLTRATAKLIRLAQAKRVLPIDDWHDYLDPVAQDLEAERIKRGFEPLL